MFFPADDYRHAPAEVVQLRVIRGDSSYAESIWGAGCGASSPAPVALGA